MRKQQSHLLPLMVLPFMCLLPPVVLAQGLTVDLGSIPAGASVTIRLRMAVQDPLPVDVTQISAQGEISGSNFSGVLTDDPDTPAPGDPTITDVFQPPVVLCQNVSRLVTSGAVASVTPEALDNGSFDPDGGALAYTLNPPGPFSIGSTPVVLTVTDDETDSATCTANVTVTGPRSPMLPPDLLQLLQDIRSGSATTSDLVDRSPDWYLILKSFGDNDLFP